MALSTSDAVGLIRQWSDDNCSVSFAFVGRGLEQSYSSGEITDVSDGIFTLKGNGYRIRYNVRGAKEANLIKVGRDAIPENVRPFCSTEDESVLILLGEGGDVVVLLKRNPGR